MRFRAFAFLSVLIASAVSGLVWHSARGLIASAERPVQRVRLQEPQEEAPPAPAAPEPPPPQAPPPEGPPPHRPTAREELDAARARLAEEEVVAPILEPRTDIPLREREELPEEAQRGAPLVSEPPGMRPGAEEGAAGQQGAAAEAAPGEPAAAEEREGEAAPGQGAAAEEGTEPPGEEEVPVDERMDELQRQLEELSADQQASRQEIEALQAAIAEREEELRFLEENRLSRIDRIDDSIAGINELEPLLASGSRDVDGDLSRIAGTLGSASSDAAQYAGQDEAHLSGLASNAVQAAREAIAREDIYAARISLGVALSQARAARVAAEGQ